MSNLAKSIIVFLTASLLALSSCSQRQAARPSLAAPLAMPLTWTGDKDLYVAKRGSTVVGTLAFSPEGWYVIEPGGTSLGGPYASVAQAKHRAERVFQK